MLNLRYAWEPYLQFGQKLEFKKNTVIYRQGDIGKGFYYLENGAVKITLLSDKGDERIINYVPTGMLLGEHGVYQEPYLTSAYATLDSTLYYFSDEAFAVICLQDPSAAMIYTNSLIYKFRILAEIISLSDSPVEQQMAHYLIKLVEENGNITLNQTSFARYIGTSRITVNKIIQKWKQQEYIRENNRQIEITNIERLLAIANNGEET